ncbi:MAG: type II secretion system F family protein [Vampirovibrionales bacterium]|nr:type II secretion system F family protein [Vampirovibrionales bacterium]
MSLDFLYALIPGLVITFLVIGVYKSMFEKKETAREHIDQLLGEKKAQGRSEAGLFSRKGSGELLKKRKKKKGQESFSDKLEIELERANLMISPSEFVMISIASGIGVALVMLMGGQHIVVAVLIGVGGAFLPRLLLAVKIFMRMKKAAAEFADVLDSMVNGFKTGYGFSKAVAMVSDNFKDPWGTEFGKMSSEMNLGVSQEEALFSMSRRIPSADVDLFVTAILIQKETGGNMSELLATLSKTCRDRFKLFQKVGAISAQGKLSASIVCCVPFALGLMMFLFLPEYMMKFLTNPIGIVLMILTGIWMVAGIGVLFKIVQIDV